MVGTIRGPGHKAGTPEGLRRNRLRLVQRFPDGRCRVVARIAPVLQ